MAFDQDYGGKIGAQSYQAKPSNPNFADAVSQAGERVETLCLRLSQLADKLVGMPPPEQGVDSLHAVPAGLLGSVMDSASRITVRAEMGLDLITRIERSLP